MTFEEWLQDNATMYRGNNASDCMKAAWQAATLAERERILAEADRIEKEIVELDIPDNECVQMVNMKEYIAAAIRKGEGV